MFYLYNCEIRLGFNHDQASVLGEKLPEVFVYDVLLNDFEISCRKSLLDA